MTPNQIMQGLSDAELCKNVVAALDWRKKGVLSGTDLGDLAARLTKEAGLPEVDALRMADTMVIEEAAARFVRQS